MRSVAAMLLALALIGACGDDDDSDEGAASTTTATAGATTTTATAPAASAAPVLKPDGIDDLQFGAPVAEVVAGIEERLGTPPEQENTAAECESSSDHTVFWPSLLLVFADDEWRGYSWTGTNPPAATDKGVRVGSTVAEVKASYPTVEIAEGTIGWEWSVEMGGDLFQTGGLTGPGDDDTVDRVSAGDICAFR